MQEENIKLLAEAKQDIEMSLSLRPAVSGNEKASLVLAKIKMELFIHKYKEDVTSICRDLNDFIMYSSDDDKKRELEGCQKWF